MTRTIIFLLLAATILVLSGLSAIRGDAQKPPQDAQATTHPTTQKASPVVAPTRPLPDKYRVLLHRSIFARDGRAAASVSQGATGKHNTPGLWVGPPGTEATLVFRGVTRSDGSYTAYIEDMTGGGVRRFWGGEAIAAGHISGITLDGMDYQSGRKVIRVALGQNLGGGDAPPPTPPTTAPTTSPSPPESPARGTGRGRFGPESAAPVEPQ